MQMRWPNPTAVVGRGDWWYSYTLVPGRFRFATESERDKETTRSTVWAPTMLRLILAST
jgi:hypothetical protein